jgi:hypothetical protein
MMSEWLKVMLDEIARKKAEAEQAREEERLRLVDAQRPGASAGGGTGSGAGNGTSGGTGAGGRTAEPEA